MFVYTSDEDLLYESKVSLVFALM